MNGTIHNSCFFNLADNILPALSFFVIINATTMRCFGLLLFLVINCTVKAQVHTDTAQSQTAIVDVIVTDMKGKPSRGEQVFFHCDKTKKNYSGRAGRDGKFSIVLPTGCAYNITIKSLTDTSKYGIIDIPAPGPDEFYTEPFRVNVKFESARSYTLDNVHFDFGKSTLRPSSFGELDELVHFLESKEQIRVEIAGHTDNVGKADDNLKLSQQRADAIRQYVIKKGIPASRITAKGYGATQPVADNSTDEGRQLNRRTEVRIL